MTTESKPLTESVLRGLTNDALTRFLSQAAQYEAAARPGLQLVLSNEPVADLNMLVVGAGADHQQFRDMVNSCLTRNLPFLVMVFPEAGEAIDELAANLGLIYAVDFPIMVRDDLLLEPSGNSEIIVARAQSPADAKASAAVAASAYGMPEATVLRAFPPSLFATPATDVFIARFNGEPVGSVTLTYHGDTCGIWAMGTIAARQRGGIGRRLLSTAMVHARNSGISRFFLGATPAGLRLYESLDFKTVCAARVWVSGETHQS
ncbi:GNAT family N-acetyltransferase [Shewanella sp.]|uniref:GNAT family N-acetyltransferase n=1 Tax=Shewanella sp. TaxID=50422 RepID=UPI0035612E88